MVLALLLDFRSLQIAAKSAPSSSSSFRLWRSFIAVGGWGEASLQGQSTPTGRSFRPVRACLTVGVTKTHVLPETTQHVASG